MDERINTFAQMIKECERIVFFGGAGVSTESGVKDYRSEDGLYNTVKEYGISPEEILSLSFFEKNPKTFYDFYRSYFLDEVEPNKAHIALGKLEAMGKIKAVVTQNIDSLHQKAGSRSVFELHGTVKEYYCYSCRQDAEDVIEEIREGKIPKCKKCGGIIKPKVVLYEEMLDNNTIHSAVDAIAKADMLIVGGTSLAVQPAASFVRYFSGKYIVMINKTCTDFDRYADIVFRESIGEVFEKVMNRLGVEM